MNPISTRSKSNQRLPIPHFINYIKKTYMSNQIKKAVYESFNNGLSSFGGVKILPSSA
jgi:hypothetical protein